MSEEAASARLRGSYRYGAVLLLAVLSLIFQLVAPDADWARAVAIAIGGGALLAIAVTSAAPESARRRGSALLAAALVTVCLLVGTGALPDAVGQMHRRAGRRDAGGARPRAHRVDPPAGRDGAGVAGALAIYVFVGLGFAAAISAIALLGDGPYFTDGGDGTSAERTYFSFTTLTTTGFGDLAAATQAGRAMAVVEMLVGQLYLVTVIGILVGNLGRRRRSPEG